VEDEVFSRVNQRAYFREIEARERVYTVVYIGLYGTRRVEEFGGKGECCHIILSFNALLSGAKIDTFSLPVAFFLAYPFIGLNIPLILPAKRDFSPFLVHSYQTFSTFAARQTGRASVSKCESNSARSLTESESHKETLVVKLLSNERKKLQD
jgi:hypothetical protein